MKKLFITLSIAAAFWANAQTVTPDNSFGSGGITNLNKLTIGYAYTISAIQSDGKI